MTKHFGITDTGFVAIQVVILLTGLLLWRKHFSPISHIPGPILAGYTRLWHVIRIFKGDINLRSIQEHERHGHFVRIAHDEVSVSHPDGIKAILLAPIPKSPWYKVLALPDKRFQTPMSETDPKRKVERSRNVASAYTLSNLIQTENHIDDTVIQLLDRLDSFSAQQTPVHLDIWLNYMAFDVIGEVTFSKCFGFLHKGQDIGGAIANSLALNSYIAAAGFFQTVHNFLLANKFVTDLKILPMGHVFNTTMAAVEERNKNPQARFDMVEHWKRQIAEHPDRMTFTDMCAIATGTVGAGADTVSSALQAVIYYLCKNPASLGLLKREIEEAQKQGLANDRVVSYADAQKLAYLQACIKESLRLFGPVPFGLARVAPPTGLTIGPQFFPAGTKLSINPWVIHYSSELWGPSAKQYKPERWLGPNAAALEKFWIPFGLGYNSCPGRNLALIEISKVAATIVRDYDVRQVDPRQEWKWKAYFTCVPHSWPCLVSRRDATEGGVVG